jgi:hypothetical protein
VLWRVTDTWRAAAAPREEKKGLAALRPRAKAMPLWITATAWTTLFAAWQIGASWARCPG